MIYPRPRSMPMIAAFAVLAACAPEAPPGERVFVSIERGDEVVAIDPATGGVARHLAAGPRPRGLALAPDGGTLYVAISGSPVGATAEADPPPADRTRDGVAVVDVASGKVARMLPAGTDPEALALSPDGRTLFVADADAGAVSAVAVDGRHAPVTARACEAPADVAVTPDGARLFVACAASDAVAMLDARTLRPLRMIPLRGGPRGLLVARDGTTLFATLEDAGKVALLAAADGRRVRQLDLGRDDSNVKPAGMAQAADGHLFVATGDAGAVLEVDPQAGAIVRRLDHVGGRPTAIALAAGGTRLVVANGGSDDVAVIDRASGKVVHRINAGKGPWGVAGAGGTAGK